MEYIFSHQADRAYQPNNADKPDGPTKPCRPLRNCVTHRRLRTCRLSACKKPPTAAPEAAFGAAKTATFKKQ